MNKFRLDRGYITVIVGTAPASDRADGKCVRLDVQDEALDSETVVELTPDEALLIASALRQRAEAAMKERDGQKSDQWTALRQTKEMMGSEA
jgi:hypothetical protein